MHDDYIEAYNREFYEKQTIGNGKNWDSSTSTEGYNFELYPQSHPIFKQRNFEIMGAKVRRIW